jgi:menaquinone-dependent protoporphyrinogen oxidase
MRILVSVASKHGATAEIGRSIAACLTANGHEVTVAEPAAVESLSGFEAAVIGSGVYAGHWLKPALELVERLGDGFSGLPTWLFSSGPIGDPPKPVEDPVDVSGLIERCRARGHRLFAGKLSKEKLSFGERAIVSALRAPYGDFRDWGAIEAWAGTIAEELAMTGSPTV